MKIMFKVDGDEQYYIIEHTDRRSIFNLVAMSMNKYLCCEYIECLQAENKLDNPRVYEVYGAKKKVPHKYTYEISYRGIPTPYGRIVDDEITVAYHTNKLIKMLQTDVDLLTEKSMVKHKTMKYNIPRDYVFSKTNVKSNADNKQYSQFVSKYKQELNEIKVLAKLLNEDISGFCGGELINLWFKVFKNGKGSSMELYSVKEKADILKQKGWDIFGDYRKERAYFEGFAFQITKWKAALACSQETLAEVLGVSKTTISRWINGSRVPKKEVQDNVLAKLKEVYLRCIAGRKM